MRLVFLLFFFTPNLIYAQYIYLGSAQKMPGDCIMLTPDEPYSEGIAYNRNKLNLEDYFEIQFDIYLGDDDNGADGITFVIHNDVRQFGAFGQWGECMGYGRFNPFSPGNSIDPSIAIEFDTYQNIYQNDPISDHIAYLENGVSRHIDYWNNDSEDFDLEDDNLHDFRFRWDPDIQEVRVFWDGVEVYRGSKNLIDEIFKGEKDVIWGFTASTGRASNLQYFCLRRLTYQLRKEIYRNSLGRG